MAVKDTIVNLVIGAQDRASKTITRFQKALGGVQGKIAAVGAAIGAYFGGRAIANFFGGAVSDAAQFEAQMDKVAAVSGATTEELEQLTATAQKMGAETSFTATQSAEALELLARAGLDAKDSINTLPTVLDLAKGNGLELAEAASQITSTTAAMGLEFAEAGRVADVLTKAAASANTNVQQLGNAMSYAGPVASSLGISVEDTAALIGKFSDAGIRGERAGTALRSVLAQMSDPASSASQALEELGISTEEPIQAIVRLAEVGPRGKEAVRAFGLEAGPALQALLNQGTASLQGLRGELNNASGAAAAAAKAMADNLPGALKGLGSAWDAIKQRLAQPLLEPIKNEIVDLTERLREFASGPEIEQFAQSLVTGFKNVAGSVRDFLREFDFKAALERVSSFTDNASKSLSTLGNTLKVIGGSVRLFVNSFTAGLRLVFQAITGVLGEISGVVATALEAFGADKWAQTARNVTESLKAASADFAAAFDEDAADISASWDSIVEAAGRTEQAYDGAADAAEQSSARQTAANAQVSQSANEAAAATERASTAQQRANAETAEGSDAQAQYSERLRKTIDDLTALTGGHKAAGPEVVRQWNDVADAIGRANDALDQHSQKADAAARAAGGFAAALGNLLKNGRKEFEEMGESAAAAYDVIVERSAINGESVDKYLKRVNGRVELLRRQYQGLNDINLDGARSQVQGLDDDLKRVQDRL